MTWGIPILPPRGRYARVPVVLVILEDELRTKKRYTSGTINLASKGKAPLFAFVHISGLIYHACSMTVPAAPMTAALFFWGKLSKRQLI